MTKRELLIDETLQNLANSDEIPFTYKQMRKIMDNYLQEEKLEKKKQRKSKINTKDNKLTEIYKRFVTEQLDNKVPLQSILNMWEDYKKQIII